MISLLKHHFLWICSMFPTAACSHSSSIELSRISDSISQPWRAASRMVVCVNKMDTEVVGFSKERFLAACQVVPRMAEKGKDMALMVRECQRWLEVMKDDWGWLQMVGGGLRSLNMDFRMI